MPLYFDLIHLGVSSVGLEVRPPQWDVAFGGG